MKGELERDIKKLNFNSIYFIRPSLLAGDRKENRAGEKIGFKLLNAVNALGLFKKYKPIHASIVAEAMINAAIEKKPGITISELNDVFTLAGRD